MPIKIELIADTPDELLEQIAALAPLAQQRGLLFRDAAGGPLPGAGPMISDDQIMTDAQGRAVAVVSFEDMGEADEADPTTAADEEDETAAAPAPEPTKRGRGRGRPAGSGNKAKKEDAAPAAEDTKPADTKPAEAADPAKVRDNAVRILIDLFSKSKAGQDKVRALQKKWGVTKFTEVELDFADKLMGDALALQKELG